MKVTQKQFSKTNGWEQIRDGNFDHSQCSLVLVFGSRELVCEEGLYHSVREEYPSAHIVINSTAGEIIDTRVNDHTVSLTAVWFERTPVKVGDIHIENAGNSFMAGRSLAGMLDHEGLKHVMVISDGQKVNGSDLVTGLQEVLPKHITITGGLAGDGAEFTRTVVGLNGVPVEGKIVAIGFYGEFISTSYGSIGGWGAFGPERLITRSEANVLYELDGKPALNMYKMYLGEHAKELPGSGLLFPLSIRDRSSEHSLVRTILGINEEENSLTFAGNMPEGNYARLMMANFDKLIEGASDAAQNSLASGAQPELAVLISCVGRKLVLNQRIEEEVEVIRSIYGNNTAIAGFYSYGEISPSHNLMKCELHNQTMTVTIFSEKLV